MSGVTGWRRIAGVALIAAGAAGCDVSLGIDLDNDLDVYGSGRLVTESHGLPPFHTVSASGVAFVRIDRNGHEGVRITAEDNVMRHLEAEVRGGVLYLGVRRGVSLNLREEIVFEVDAVELVEVRGSGAIDVEAHIGRQDEFWVHLSGASYLRSFGDVERQDVDLSGASEYDGLDLGAERTHVVASGASRAWVWAEDRLDAVASGASEIWFRGDPIVFASESGGARVRHY